MGHVLNPPTSTTLQYFIIPGTHSITRGKKVGSTSYLSWSASVKMQFKGQSHDNHLTKIVAYIVQLKHAKWEA